MIVAQDGRSISDIFQQNGESYFRRLEKGVITEITSGTGEVVVALGGGALHNQQLIKRIKKSGTLVYLKLSTEHIANRLEKSRNVRPLLFDDRGNRLSGPALQEKISSLLSPRVPYYEQAHVVYEPPPSKDIAATELIELLSSRAI